MGQLPSIIDKKSGAYLVDNFDDGSIASFWDQRPGNGSITESAGQVHLVAPELVDCNLWENDLMLITSLGKSKDLNAPIVIDAYLDEFNNAGSNSVEGGLAIMPWHPDEWASYYNQNDASKLDLYAHTWYAGDSYIRVRRWVDDTNSDQYNSRYTGHPRPSVTQPYLFRIIYNCTETGVGGLWPFVDGSTSYWHLPAGYVWFSWSKDAGTTWYSAVSQAPPDWHHGNTKLHWVGLHLRKWASGAGHTADQHWSKFEAGIIDQDMWKWTPNGPQDLLSGQSYSFPSLPDTTRAALKDELVLPPKRHGMRDFISGENRGVLLPGSTQETAYQTDEEHKAGGNALKGMAPSTFEDDVDLYRGGGPDRFQSTGVPVGSVHVPGPAAQPDLDWSDDVEGGAGEGTAHGERQKPAAGAKDAAGPFPQGGKPYYTTPEYEEGVRIDGGLHELIAPDDTYKRPIGRQGSGVLDEVVYELTDADYMEDKDDADGHEFFYDESRNIVLRIPYDASKGFDDPTGHNHWGADRNGQLYADGVACGSEGIDFGTLAAGKKRTAWRFTDPGQLMQREPYYNTNPAWYTEVLSADDELEITHTGCPGDWIPEITSHGKWYLPDGDFDVEIEFDEFTGTQEQNRIEFGVGNSRGGNPGANMVYMYIRQNSSVGYLAAREISGGYAELGRIAMAPPSGGRMRITRVSNVYQCYKWDSGDAGWVAVGASYSHTSLEGLNYVWMGYWCDDGASGHCKLRNFTINSAAGSIVTTVSWAREAPGDHRGNQGPMPTELAAVATPYSLELIDTANNRLWMRFLRGSNYGFIDNGGNSVIRDMAWDDGVLLLAVGRDDAEGQEGNVIVIDFTMDYIRYHREAASTVCGAFFQHWIYHEPSHIANRNIGYGWANDNDTWHIEDYRTRSVALLHDAGYQYRAIGSLEGLNVFKWLRWNMNGAPGGVNDDDWGLVKSTATEVTEMVGCHFHLDELFYWDNDNIYSRDRTNGGSTGWEDTIGATFSAENTKAFPAATVYYDEQLRKMVFYQPATTLYIYIVRVEGVYRVEWPSGSWELFYGQGGTHDILGVYEKVSAIEMANDGTTDLLVIGIETAEGSRILAVRMDAHTIYGKTIERESTRSPRGIAA